MKPSARGLYKIVHYDGLAKNVTEQRDLSSLRESDSLSARAQINGQD